MEYILTKWGRGLKNLKIEIYNQKLQLIYSGQFDKSQDSKMKRVLDGCSLLFDTHDTGYFLKKN
jgi:hypothetical protein